MSEEFLKILSLIEAVAPETKADCDKDDGMPLWWLRRPAYSLITQLFAIVILSFGFFALYGAYTVIRWLL